MMQRCFLTLREYRHGAVSAALLAMAILLAGAGEASAQIKTRKADCYFEKAGQVVIDGTCEFLTDDKDYGPGGFRIANYDAGYVRYLAEVNLIDGPAQGTWNEERGRKTVDVTRGNLGALGAEGACWVGRDSRVCAWKLGEGRPGFKTGSYGVPPAPVGDQRPAPGLSRKTMAADCFFEQEDSVLINGPCGFETDPAYGPGGFRIISYLGGEIRHFALVRRVERSGEVSLEWNTLPGKPNTVTSVGGLKKDGACWSLRGLDSSTRVCAWKLGQERAGFEGPASSPSLDNRPLTSQGTTTSTADCYFEVDGQVPLDGLCRFMRNTFYGPGGFGIASFMTDRKVFLVNLKRKEGDPDGIGFGLWNGRPGLMQVATPVGELTANGPCWVGARARICAWRLGESRGDFTPASGERPPPDQRAQKQPPEPPPSGGSQPPEKSTRITLTFRGACEQFVVDGENATPRCAPFMTNMSVTGQAETEFTFSATDGTKLVFIGRGQGKIEGSSLLQPIGALSLEAGGARLRKEANGRCRMPDPKAGAITIECDATTENSAYVARFRTDGRQPDLDERGP